MSVWGYEKRRSKTLCRITCYGTGGPRPEFDTRYGNYPDTELETSLASLLPAGGPERVSCAV